MNIVERNKHTFVSPIYNLTSKYPLANASIHDLEIHKPTSNVK